MPRDGGPPPVAVEASAPAVTIMMPSFDYHDSSDSGSDFHAEGTENSDGSDGADSQDLSLIL
jgi:hypothetical protein